MSSFEKPQRVLKLCTYFIITVDVEGDNLWEKPIPETTKNALCIPRFQELCSSYKFKPTYLVDYEMANDRFFQQFGRQVLRTGEAEVGMHLHAWNTPPLSGNEGPSPYPVYITELSDEAMFKKMQFMTVLLTQIFDITPISHRAGRYGFDERVARVLETLGYKVDCSVTPGRSWIHSKGDPRGRGGPDYYGFNASPYFLDLEDIRHAGNSSILEVPLTVRPRRSRLLTQASHAVSKQSLAARFVDRFIKPFSWLMLRGHNLDEMIELIDWALANDLSVLELTLHSSELLAGANPYFHETRDIEKLHHDYNSLFSHIASRHVTGITLADYRKTFEVTRK